MAYRIFSIIAITAAMLVLTVSLGSISNEAFATTNATAAVPSGASTQNATSSGANDAGNAKVRVIVIFDAKEENRQEVLNNLNTLTDMGKQREGNLAFDLYALTENPNELLIDQLWSNKTVYETHYNSPDTAEIRETVTPLLVQPPLFKVYTEINNTQS
ncbi:MAG TPA: putative quinol monooxygenase [Candidatus Nitrosocosmicus sp.]|nr:putative quinol monooxygenase [Candidatus Nitrosocosmicus sp.]